MSFAVSFVYSSRMTSKKLGDCRKKRSGKVGGDDSWLMTAILPGCVMEGIFGTYSIMTNNAAMPIRLTTSQDNALYCMEFLSPTNTLAATASSTTKRQANAN